jgi:hypothetical protein
MAKTTFEIVHPHAAGIDVHSGTGKGVRLIFINSTSPKVQYAYSEMASSANHSRPTSMTYPNGRVLTDSYGSGLNNIISRLDALTESSGSVTLEGYTYLGLGTVAKRSHANGVALNYITANSSNDAGDTVGGLDRFGRILVQDWQLTSGTVTTSVDRFDYTYDRNGNRLTKSNWVANNTYSLGDDFDETYTYDGLNQISSMSRGDGFDQSWTYDGLGNWTSFNGGEKRGQVRLLMTSWLCSIG